MDGSTCSTPAFAIPRRHLAVICSRGAATGGSQAEVGQGETPGLGNGKISREPRRGDSTDSAIALSPLLGCVPLAPLPRACSLGFAFARCALGYHRSPLRGSQSGSDVKLGPRGLLNLCRRLQHPHQQLVQPLARRPVPRASGAGRCSSRPRSSWAPLAARVARAVAVAVGEDQVAVVAVDARRPATSRTTGEFRWCAQQPLHRLRCGP